MYTGSLEKKAMGSEGYLYRNSKISVNLIFPNKTFLF